MNSQNNIRQKQLNDKNEQQLLDEEVQIIKYGKPPQLIQYEHSPQTRQESLSLIENLEEQMKKNINKPIAVITGQEDAEVFSYDVIDYINIPLSDGTVEKAEVQDWALTARTKGSMGGQRKKEFEKQFQLHYGKKEAKRRFLLTDQEYQLIIFALNDLVSNSQMLKLKQEFLEGKLNALFTDKEVELMVNKFLSKQKLEYIIKIPAIRTALSKSDYAKSLDLFDLPDKVKFKKTKNNTEISKKGQIGNELDVNLIYHNVDNFKSSLSTLIKKRMEAYPSKFTRDALYYISQLANNQLQIEQTSSNNTSTTSSITINQQIQNGIKKIVKNPKVILPKEQTTSIEKDQTTQIQSDQTTSIQLEQSSSIQQEQSSSNQQEQATSIQLEQSSPIQYEQILSEDALDSQSNAKQEDLPDQIYEIISPEEIQIDVLSNLPNNDKSQQASKNYPQSSSISNNFENVPIYQRLLDTKSVLEQLLQRDVQINFKLNKKQKSIERVIQISENLLQQMNTHQDNKVLLEEIVSKAETLYNKKYVEGKLKEIESKFGVSPLTK